MVFGTDRRVLTLALARMADALGNSFLIIVLPLYVASGQIDISALVGSEVVGVTLTEELLIGIVLSLFGFLNSLTQPFTGRLSDRTGQRKAYILFGLALFGVSSATYPFVHSYVPVLVLRAVQGLGAAFTIPCTIALVNEYAASNAERGGNFGVFNTFRLVGFGFGPILAGAVVATGPYVLSGVTVSGFAAAFAVAVLGVAVSFTFVTLLISDPERTDASAGESLSFRVFDADGGLDPVFVLGVAILLMAVSIALFATIQEAVRTHLDEGALLFSIQFAAVVIANIALQVPVGRACDRFGRRPFIVAGFALLVPSVAAQGYVADIGALLAETLALGAGDLVAPILLVVFRLLQGVAVALVFTPGLALAGDLAGRGQSGTTLSVLTMAFGLGLAIGPLASGFLVRYGFAVPFLFGAALSAAGLVLAYFGVEETFAPEEVRAGMDVSLQDD